MELKNDSRQSEIVREKYLGN